MAKVNEQELVDILRSYYQNAPWGDKTLAVQFLAIRYADQLKDVSKTKLSREALDKNYSATINNGVKLANYVRITNNPFC